MPATNGKIEHVFVLMLENRSYDHLLGFSPIEGADAATGLPTRANALTGSETNTWSGKTYQVATGAPYVMPVDPGHELRDVVAQLAGAGASYNPAGPFPNIDNSGYVANYAASGGGASPGDVMKCYAADNLPVINALAREFVLCDNWHASMPGPTWPNRMFVHAASSGGLDHSPTVLEIVQWESVQGFAFTNGTLFDRLAEGGQTRRLYGGDDFPMVAALKGIGLADVRRYENFAADLQQDQFPFTYVFIEPSYDVFHEYRSGNSQHPLGDVRRGEALIKSTYEAIRNSPHWDHSLLIVTWDEHGGFFDHGVPPAAPPPGDTAQFSVHNREGFRFDLYGPRVPALIVSPMIPKNLIDHRVYDHTSIPATVEALFDLPPMTARDRLANRLNTLLTLAEPRTDAPTSLPGAMEAGVSAVSAAAVKAMSPSVTRPQETVNQGNVPAVVHAAMQQQLALAPAARAAILERVKAIHTRAQAREYLLEVRQTTRPAKSASQGS